MIKMINIKIPKEFSFGILSCQKTMLQMNDNRAAGEREGAKAPLVIRL